MKLNLIDRLWFGFSLDRRDIMLPDITEIDLENEAAKLEAAANEKPSVQSPRFAWLDTSTTLVAFLIVAGAGVTFDGHGCLGGLGCR